MDRQSIDRQSLKIEETAKTLIQQLAQHTLAETAQIAAMEHRVLTTLEQIKQALIDLQHRPERAAYEQIYQKYASQLQQLAVEHRQQKQQRQHQREHLHHQMQGEALATALADLTKASQHDSTERRQLKQERERALEPFTQLIIQSDQRIQTLKQHYTALSKQWRTQLQLTYSVPDTAEPLHILYQDDYLVVIDKPAGLLSVPGRRYHLQDSVLSRLQHQLPGQTFLQTVHRLDQATSGVLAIALSPATHKALSQQFAQGQIHKTYEAILSQPIQQTTGTLNLPLWSDPENRPKQFVDGKRGKPSQTDFRVLAMGDNPRVEFRPLTGRTHQIRVHAAHPQGLNSPIAGDTLYGKNNALHEKKREEKRLFLHATDLKLTHPKQGKIMHFKSQSPF